METTYSQIKQSKQKNICQKCVYMKNFRPMVIGVMRDEKMAKGFKKAHVSIIRRFERKFPAPLWSYEYVGTANAFFPFTGTTKRYPSALATVAPTRSPVNEPGPSATSIAVISDSLALCSRNNSSISGKTI